MHTSNANTHTTVAGVFMAGWNGLMLAMTVILFKAGIMQRRCECCESLDSFNLQNVVTDAWNVKATYCNESATQFTA